MSEEEINVKFDNCKYSIKTPLITKEELETIDTFQDEIAKQFMNAYIKDKDLLLSQYLVKKLDDKNKQLQQENKELKENRDKAIEYTKQIDDFDIKGFIRRTLLKILGSDK